MIPVIGSLSLAIGYSVVVGWIFKYAFKAFTGEILSPTGVDEYEAGFVAMASNFGNNGWQIFGLIAAFLT